ncbi:MAG: PsbP-related protein [Candidatus Saccharibacteria bacterium]
MKIKNNQDGIAHIAAILAVVVVVAIGAVGWKVWDNKNKKKTNIVLNNNTKVIDNSVNSTTKDVDTIDKYSAWKTYNAKFKTRLNGEADFSFKYPPDWVMFESQPTNGVYINSPDFKSEVGFKNISVGSLLTVSADINDKNIYGHIPTLDEKANIYMGVTDKKTKKVNGIQVLQFKTSGGENHSGNYVTLIINDDKIYTISQNYKLDAENPYPDLINGVLATLKLN